MTDFLESFTPGLPAQAVAATPPPARRVWRNARVATLADASGWGLIERGAIVTEDARIAWVGAEADLPRTRGAVAEEHDLGGALLTPGLIDAHTHLVYGGHRAHEFEMRLQGASYEDIAKAGGGIRSTVAATRAASEDELFALASRRLHTLRAGGVTTVEIKSGYGLSFEDEARCLRVARRLGRSGVTVRTTSLAAHALPPEFEGRADDYIAAVCEWLPKWHAEGLVDAVDAFCERIAFSPAQVERVFATAASLGLPVKLHAEQLSDSGGAELASRFHALSCDHLEHLSEPASPRCARPARWRCCCRARIHFLRETKLPPIAALREAGVAMAVVHRPQPRHLAHAVAAADDPPGLRRLPPHARGGRARRHRQRGPRAGAGRPRHAGRRPARRLRAVVAGAPARAGLLVRPPGLPRHRRRRRFDKDHRVS
jgi:imidazolonepropionase